MKRFAMMVGVLGLALGTAGVRAQAPVELKVGDMAPAFSLPGTDGKTHTLADYKGKMVVLAWFPKAFTSGCTKECRSIRDSAEAIKKFDVAYFMASVDPPDVNKQFAEQEQVNFPFLSDPEKHVALAYGVVSQPTPGFAKRWTFYIGPDGKIAYIDKDVNPNVTTAGADLASRLAALGAKKK